MRSGTVASEVKTGGAARHPQRICPGSGAAPGRCKLHKRANSGQKMPQQNATAERKVLVRLNDAS